MIKKKQATDSMLVLLSFVLIFHLLVVTQVIPYELVWAGKIKTLEEMYFFEGISILLNGFLIYVILQKGHYVRRIIKESGLNAILWLFVVLFGLNTLGNLFAQNKIELIFGSILTFVSSLLCWLIVKKDNSTQSSSQ